MEIEKMQKTDGQQICFNQNGDNNTQIGTVTNFIYLTESNSAAMQDVLMEYLLYRKMRLSCMLQAVKAVRPKRSEGFRILTYTQPDGILCFVGKSLSSLDIAALARCA